MSNRYVVWSRVTVDDIAKEVVEVSRSDRKVAEDDAALIRDVLHRNAWVQDTEEQRK